MEPTYETAQRELATLLDQLGIVVTVRGGSVKQDQDGWKHRAWSTTITREGYTAVMRVPYRSGMGVSSIPTAVDVVAAVVRDGSVPDTFTEFCAEFGYDEDSRKAYRTWRTCRDYAERFRAFEISATATKRLRDLAAAL